VDFEKIESDHSSSAPLAIRGGCIVTGVAGGIGRALALAFHHAGYHVIGTDRGALAPGLQLGAYIAADLDRLTADQSLAGETWARIRQALGGLPLKVLVNNAALQCLGPAEHLSRADWTSTLNVNLTAPFLLTQALLPELEAAGGCVINISSIHARLTKPGFVAYATSKAALSGMTRALAVDLAGRVRVNAIEPAAIASDMLRAGFAGRDAAFAALEACHPQGRIGSPEEVAALALALADGQLRFLHGACIAIDGGIGARLHDPV
jgi:NAD(P)-dependent dehydrogenase (short-subunit alcohol dehydrogenase family)